MFREWGIGRGEPACYTLAAADTRGGNCALADANGVTQSRRSIPEKEKR